MTSTEPPGIVAEYLMARVYKKSYLMLEGKTDEDTWGKFVAHQCCHIHALPYGAGKDKIMAALKLELSERKGVAGLIDADYWLITNSTELQMKNLVYDSFYPDSEMILLSSPALSDVLRCKLDLPDNERIDEFAEKLQKQALRLAAEFGYFRLLNHLKDYGLRCNAIRFDEVIDKNTLELDRDWIAKRLAEDNADISSEELLREVEELREAYPPGNSQLCRGKDVAAIMAMILPLHFKAEFGDDLSPSMNDKELSIRLRTAYEYGYFKQTSLFLCIQEWESANSPYKILKPKI